MIIEYGLLIYLNSINLGDEIQSIAARRLLPKEPRFYIDRDSGVIFEKKDDHLIQVEEKDLINIKIKCIVNGWFDGDYCKAFVKVEPLFDPLYISIHINEEPKDKSYDCLEKKEGTHLLENEENKKYFESYLKNNEIGCRDEHTLKKFQSTFLSNNIYFSGCLTLTLGGKPKGYSGGDKPEGESKQEDKPEKILINDVQEEMYDYIPREIEQKADKISNVSYTKDPLKRLQEAEELLEKYKKYSLIITSRLHCALPCLAFNIPVILLYNKIDPRFTGLDTYLTIYTPDKLKTWPSSGQAVDVRDLSKKIENKINNWLRLV